MCDDLRQGKVVAFLEELLRPFNAETNNPAKAAADRPDAPDEGEECGSSDVVSRWDGP
jgi:hypothetical protein